MTRNTRDKWLPIIRAFQQSPLSRDDFAESRGLNPSTFRNYYYRLRHLLADEPPQPTGPPFFELRLEDPTPAPQDPLTLELPAGLRLRFDRLPDPRYLAELVASLRGQ